EDLESLFADTDIFAEDPTLNETAINDSILGGDLGSTTDPTDSLFENSLLDDSQTTTTQTSNDPFADFFGSTVNSGTNDLLTSGVDVETLADPTTTDVVGRTTGVLTCTTTPTSITGINSLTQPRSSPELSSILNSMNSTPSTGNILDAGGGTSQILQMSS